MPPELLTGKFLPVCDDEFDVFSVNKFLIGPVDGIFENQIPLFLWPA
jgi:hypothetical protein